MSLKPLRSVRWTAAFLLLGPLPLAAQQLDDSLLDQAEERPARQWDWNAGEAGIWNVWLELDAGTIEQFDNRTTNNIRQVATLGHAEWSDNTLTMAMNRIDNSGFSNVVDNQGWYVPNAVRVGAARQVWKGLSAGIQLGRAWSPAYINCVRADGEAVVASWNQVRFADLVDQYLYYDDLYDGDQWRYENDGVFGERASPAGARKSCCNKNSPTDWDGRQAWGRPWDSSGNLSPALPLCLAAKDCCPKMSSAPP